MYLAESAHIKEQLVKQKKKYQISQNEAATDADTV